MKRKPKVDYYNLEFNKCRKDITKTWEAIADVISKSKMQNKFTTHYNVNGIQLHDKKIANKLKNKQEESRDSVQIYTD